MKKTTIIWTIAIIVVLIIAYYLISPAFKSIESDDKFPEGFMEAMEEAKGNVMEMSDDMPSQANILKQANFIADAHEVSGNALIIELEGKKYLRFENFETINGPNLHIYLSADLNAKDYIDLGAIKATKGNVNYEIPEGTDLEKYDKVLVWCVPFKVLFSYAELR